MARLDVGDEGPADIVHAAGQKRSHGHRCISPLCTENLS
jgi:hypothetical protein